ncbi:MAG: metallophosphoesterase family protein [Kiloniellales bacterium]
MRLALISDIHANLEALQATLQAISSQDVDRIVCLGDIVGYNSNPAECLALLRDADALCVAGSHDRAAAGLITTEGFSSSAAQGVAWTRARLDVDDLEFLAALPLQVSMQGQLVGVHGALLPEGGCDTTRLTTEKGRRTSFEALAAHASGARVCAFGHTHRLGLFELRDGVERELAGDEVSLRDDAYYLVNPGAVGQPRKTKDHRATYMLFDTSRRIVTVHRVAYDFAKAMAKSRKAGLAPAYYAIPAPLRATLAWGARTLGVLNAAKRLADSRQRRRREAGRN